MSEAASSSLDRQRITSHRDSLGNKNLEEFESSETQSFEEVKAGCIRYLRIAGYENVADKFEDCSEDYAVFECGDCGKEFSAPITCDLRICPSCRSRLRGNLIGKLKSLIENVEHNRHMILTVPNLPNDTPPSEINRKVREIKKRFGQLRRRKYFDERVKGCIYGVEVKQGDTGYNIHLHAFLSLKIPFIDYQRVSNMWCEYFPSAEPSAQEFRKHGDNETALIEVVSYSTKGAYFESGEAMAKWFIATKGSRLVGCTGVFFDASLSREKEYIECPYCGSRAVKYIGKWSEISPHTISREPPPTINEVQRLEGDENGCDL